MTDARAVAAAEDPALAPYLLIGAEDERDEIAEIIARHYAPLVEAARKVVAVEMYDWFNTTEIQGVVDDLRAALGGE